MNGPYSSPPISPRNPTNHHWTLTPGFWVNVVLVILTGIIAWLAIKEWYLKTDKPVDTSINQPNRYTGDQNNLAPPNNNTGSVPPNNSSPPNNNTGSN